MFKPYASIQNKILIDYKRFRDDILKGIKALKQRDLDTEKKNKVISLLTQKVHEAVNNYKKNQETLQDVRRSYQLTPNNETLTGISLKEQGSQNSITLNNFKRKIL